MNSLACISQSYRLLVIFGSATLIMVNTYVFGHQIKTRVSAALPLSWTKMDLVENLTILGL